MPQGAASSTGEKLEINAEIGMRINGKSKPSDFKLLFAKGRGGRGTSLLYEKYCSAIGSAFFIAPYNYSECKS